MRKMSSAAVAIGTLLILPAMSLAATAASTTQPMAVKSSYATTAKVPTHATRGVVTSMDATKLVIERSPQYEGNMTLTLNPSTQGLGDVRVGSTVSVRYRTEADQRIATAVTVEHAKAAPSTSGAHQ